MHHFESDMEDKHHLINSLCMYQIVGIAIKSVIDLDVSPTIQFCI